MNSEQRARVMYVTGATKQEMKRAEADAGPDFLAALGSVLSERENIEVKEGTRADWNAQRGAMLATRWRKNHPDLAALFPAEEA